MPILHAECQKDHIARQLVLFSLFETSLLHIFAFVVSDRFLGDFRFETPGIIKLLFLLKYLSPEVSALCPPPSNLY